MSIKGYELMRLAKENPEKYIDKIFKVTKGSIGINHCCDDVLIIENGNLIYQKDKHYAYVTSNTELEEIKQPVTAQEAAKAYLEGKNVYCELDSDKGTFKKDYIATSLIIKLIANGTWYIEE